MEKYELTVLMSGKTTPAKAKSFKQKLEKTMTSIKGKTAESKEWGNLDLAYEIANNSSGFFLHFILELNKGSLPKLNESLKMDESVLRHLLVKVEK